MAANTSVATRSSAARMPQKSKTFRTIVDLLASLGMQYCHSVPFATSSGRTPPASGASAATRQPRGTPYSPECVEEVVSEDHLQIVYRPGPDGIDSGGSAVVVYFSGPTCLPARRRTSISSEEVA